MIEIASDQDAALERYASKWTEQGYRLVKNPHGAELPAFLGSYRPDAILLSPPNLGLENIIVEVLYKGQSDALQRIEAIRSVLAGSNEWRLEVLYAGVPPPSLVPTSANRLRETLDRLDGTDDQDPGAFLMLWPVLEAAARILVPSATRRPQSPGRVVELLAAEGYVVPSDADVLRKSAALRNRLIHGDLDADVTPDLRRETERIARDLVASLEPPQLAI